MSLNEPVTITLPAHIWLGFMFAYSDSEWSNLCAGKIAFEAQKAVMDPVYVKEQEAKIQAQADMQHAAFHHMFTGQHPENPPNVTDVGPFGINWPSTEPDQDG